jgi:hypothetical protein
MSALPIQQPIVMRRSGVRAPRIHRELTLVRRRDNESPVTGSWSCGCDYFQEHRFCAHTLHMQSAARLG